MLEPHHSHQHRRQQPRQYGWVLDAVALILLAFFILLFFFAPRTQNQTSLRQVIPSSFLDVNTIFLSIVIEAIPFILLGVFVSALIQVFVTPESLQRFIPKNAYAALLPAALLGAIFPICECAIIPVVRRLIIKGMPLHVGVVFLVAAPILNPVVFASTYFAFKGNPEILYSRMLLAFILSIIIGAILYLFFKRTNQLKAAARIDHSTSL